MLVRFRAATAALLAVVVVLAGPAAAASAAGTPTPRPTPLIGPQISKPSASPSPSPSLSPTISAAEAQKALRRQQAALAEDRARLGEATDRAAVSLQAYQEALRAADRAVQVARGEATRLLEAERKTALGRARLTAYVASLYRSGMVDPKLSMIASAVYAPDPKQFLGGLGLADQVAGRQSDALTGFAAAQLAQTEAARRSAVAAQAQRLAAARAAAAKAAADRVVKDFADRVALRKQALALTRGALANAQRRDAMLERAERIAQIRSRPPELAIQGALANRPEAKCKGKSTTGYQNGRIPAEALCRLWGTYQHILRADAAASFDAMSREYALTFAKPICVSDSYRSYEEQQAVATEKPELAARPGTSNHGWGVATDLCDGIQVYGSKQYRWMTENSMRFGWFLPDWAQQTGSKPEPWHWEYAG